ncbi:unnamed protein product [Closterium sp. NIES-65]|nr:unnamed protein product [Closterium sp. NIES-65]
MLVSGNLRSTVRAEAAGDEGEAGDAGSGGVQFARRLSGGTLRAGKGGEGREGGGGGNPLAKGTGLRLQFDVSLHIRTGDCPFPFPPSPSLTTFPQPFPPTTSPTSLHPTTFPPTTFPNHFSWATFPRTTFPPSFGLPHCGDSDAACLLQRSHVAHDVASLFLQASHWLCLSSLLQLFRFRKWAAELRAADMRAASMGVEDERVAKKVDRRWALLAASEEWVAKTEASLSLGTRVAKQVRGEKRREEDGRGGQRGREEMRGGKCCSGGEMRVGGKD